MKKFILFLIIISFSEGAHAKKLCEIYDWLACPSSSGGSRNTTSSSHPTSSAATASNPASMSTDKGFGIETIKFGPWYDVNVVSGTGVVGSALSVSSTEGTFFGGVPQETLNEHVPRNFEGRKYKSQKFSSVVAINVLGGKKSKRSKLKMNVGLVGKYNSETKKFRSGGGLSMSFMGVSAGAARYSDDDVITPGTINRYYTNSYSLGVQFGNIAVDWNYMKTDASIWSRTRFITATLYTKHLMFTYGQRQEQSFYPSIIDNTSNAFDFNSTKHDGFLGVQGTVFKRIVLGLYLNYYLQNEISLGMSFFI